MSTPRPALKRKGAPRSSCAEPVDLKTWKCSGFLNGAGVAVISPSSMAVLAQNGCYGKGTHSRSIPVHVARSEVIREPSEKKLNLEQHAKTVLYLDSTSGGQRLHEGGAFEEAAATPCPQSDKEYLQLSGEEALYLNHEVGCLQVTSPVQATKAYSSAELWSVFKAHNPHFVELYVAYCYYRRKGWVPKSGLKYGVQYVLYRGSPEVYHSSYGVLVRPCEVGSGDCTPGLRWRDVIAASRVSESVCKELVVCYVAKVAPSGTVEEASLDFSDCARTFDVREVFVTRMVPEKQ